MSKATKGQMKTEAIRRMADLHMHPNAIEDFKNGVVNYSVEGILFWATNEILEYVRDFEHRTGNVVYHIVENRYQDIGCLLTLLYVSPDTDEWEQDRKDLLTGEIFTYVINTDYECFSEYGMVGIAPFVGGIRRTF